MNVIESVVYCAAGLILLTLSTARNFNKSSVYKDLYLPLIFIILPLLVSFIIKIVTCLCCIPGIKVLIKKVKKVLKCETGDTDALLPQDLPDRLQHPQYYEPSQYYFVSVAMYSYFSTHSSSENVLVSVRSIINLS